MKIVIVGSTDHGKSTLVARLLIDSNSIESNRVKSIETVCKSLGKPMEISYIVDALDEERTNDMTIDTTRRRFQYDNSREYTLIDTPGHLEFLRNMFIGASSADAAILLVDVTEGITDQTRRHYNLIRLLGIDQVVVAVNKTDLVGYDEDKFRVLADDIYYELDVDGMYIVPISARDGDNVILPSRRIVKEFNYRTIISALDGMVCPEDLMYAPTRFTVQGNYGGIVQGKLLSGRISVGGTLHTRCYLHEVTVDAIYNGMTPVDDISAGKSASLDVGTTINRGTLLYAGIVPDYTTTIHGTILWVDDAPLQYGDTLTLRHLTFSTQCRVHIESRIDTATLEDAGTMDIRTNDIATVRLHTLHRMAIDKYTDIPSTGRFVLTKGGNICAGGIIQ